MESNADKPGHCRRCGKPLSKDVADGLCAACLMAAAAESITQSAGDAPTEWGGDASEAGDGVSRLVPGQGWGPYRVGRLLGRGGMGEVYEAEHTRSGRRLALKVLRSRLENADERARFLREGQLAASVSHPHIVYIFGSEEISGTPVISMELTPGGTLKDRVATKGPLPPAEAASAVLDIIGGLDAAQSVGILHRDIKPSNCFVDSLGNVKVGDFGLSISTLARDVQDDVSGRGFQGTPQFASPEQLRGEPLDVRSDIYAVGATLYYLLTGQPPIEADNLRELAERVTTETPKSPRLLRPGIPSALANVVLHCLAKTPAERPASYAALADALRPFTAARHEPARLGVRFFAGTVDSLIAGLLLMPLARGAAGVGSDMLFSESMLLGWANAFVYFLMEGFWGATPGKWLLGLRVRTAGGGVAPWSRIARRHFVYNLPSVVWIIAIAVVGAARIDELAEQSLLFTMLMSFSMLALMAMLFLTARRTNGWAALHDLSSGTRVVLRSKAASRRTTASSGTAPLPGEQVAAGMNYGPFRVLSDAGPAGEGRLFVGFDPALRRRVWIQTHPPGTPEISAARRDASRTGRLHWLSGRRSGEENWDAFEAPDGESLAAHRGRTSWAALKLWLLDLANELHAAVQEQTLPALALDRLWIRSDGRLVLLDFPATGMSAHSQAARSNGSLTPVRLLAAATEFCLAEPNGPHPLPLRARNAIDRWTALNPPELAEARASLVELSSAADHTSKRRRALVIGLTAVPLLFGIVSAGTALGIRTSLPAEQREMLLLLQVADAENPVYRAAVEQYLAAHHRALLLDDDFWRSQAAGAMTLDTTAMRELAADIAARYPSVSEADATRAEQVIAQRLELIRRLENPLTAVAQGVGLIGIIMTILIVVWGLIWSAILPGGPLLRANGLAVVTRDGREISRLRSAARVLIAWSAPFAWAIALWVYAEIVTGDPLAYTSLWGIGGIYLLPAIGALWTIAHPSQGLHDRLAGTWVVPR